MRTLNTIVIESVNSNVIDPQGLISYMENFDTLAGRLKYARELRGYAKQEDLAKDAGVAQATIANYEGARGNDPDADHSRKAYLIPLAKTLRVSQDWLMHNRGPMEPHDKNHENEKFNEEAINLRKSDTGFDPDLRKRAIDKTPFHHAAIVRWPGKGEELNNKSHHASRHALIPGEHSDLTQVVQVPDASMRPEIEEGEFIAVDPKRKARNGSVVIVKDRHGDFHLRRYRHVIGDEFEAWATNPHFSTLDSKKHGLSVAAVVVCHMRIFH